MRNQIRRREFITLLGGAAAAWPVAAGAQRPAMPVVGFLRFGRPESNPRTVAAFRRGLERGGYIEGRNVAIEYRWEQGDQRDLLAKTADLVRRRVDVLVTAGGVPEALAARDATCTIPIVILGGFDPVKYGLVASLNRPGGNVTGVTVFGAELAGKRFGLLHNHAAPRNLAGEGFQFLRQRIAGPREQVVRLERFRLREPEIRNLREHLAFARNAVGHDHVEGRDAVGRDEEQTVAEIKDFADLAAFELLDAGQVQCQQRFGRHAAKV